MSWVVPEIMTDSQESNCPVKPTHPLANLSGRLSKVHWSQGTWKGPHWKSGRRLSGLAETRLAEGPRGDSPCPMAPSTLALVKSCSAARPGSHWCSQLDPGQGSGLAVLGVYTPSRPQERKGVGLLGSYSDSAFMGPGRTEGAK